MERVRREKSQTKRPRALEALKWGAHAASMYASCTQCGLGSCIMRRKAGAFVTDSKIRQVDAASVHIVELAPGLVMIDAGCRAAVGGAQWHAALQEHVRTLDKPFTCERQVEYFQFGPGAPIKSAKRWCYQVGIQGVDTTLKISEVLVGVPVSSAPKNSRSGRRRWTSARGRTRQLREEPLRLRLPGQAIRV